VVDDETVLTDLLLDSLTFAGYRVDTAGNGTQALAAVSTKRPDLVLLDVNLPDFNGFAVAARLRASGDKTPIVYLTARDAPADLRDGFGTGADDYLTKPFRLEELRMRIEAVLRRTMGDQGSPADATGVLNVGDLVVDPESGTAWRGSVVLELSDRQFALLRYLATNHSKVLSESDIVTHVWGATLGNHDIDVAKHMADLKWKVDCVSPPLISTVGSSGYILRAPKS
jgi:two-component system OmpR family response regulator